MSVGLLDGDAEGSNDGDGVGSDDGDAEGFGLETLVGCADGDADGAADGMELGPDVGDADGEELGSLVGLLVGGARYTQIGARRPFAALGKTHALINRSSKKEDLMTLIFDLQIDSGVGLFVALIYYIRCIYDARLWVWR